MTTGRLQYLCSSCHTVLREISKPVDDPTSEECPKCGSLLSETLLLKQRRHHDNIQLPKFEKIHAGFSSYLNFDIVALDRILQLGVGESVCIMGLHSRILRDRLCIRSLLSERYGGFNSPNVIIIDAGNNSDVYQCVNFARQYGMDITSVLRRIIVSRPFTIYQLANLIIYELSRITERWKTKIIIISDLLHMFLEDPQVEIEESKYLIKQITKSVGQYLNKSLVITTLHDNKYSPYNQILLTKFHKIIEITNDGMANIRDRNKEQSIRIRENDLSTISLT